MPVNVKDDIVRQDLTDHKNDVGTVHPEFVRKESGEYLDEAPTGNIDGVNTTFTITVPVIPETIEFIDTDFPYPLFRVVSGPIAGEYTYDGNVTFTTGAAPETGHRIRIKGVKTQS